MSRGDKRDRDRAKNQAKQLAKSKSQSKVGQYRTLRSTVQICMRKTTNTDSTAFSSRTILTNHIPTYIHYSSYRQATLLNGMHRIKQH